jgi:hypothetical protein
MLLGVSAVTSGPRSCRRGPLTLRLTTFVWMQPNNSDNGHGARRDPQRTRRSSVPLFAVRIGRHKGQDERGVVEVCTPLKTGDVHRGGSPHTCNRIFDRSYQADSQTGTQKRMQAWSTLQGMKRDAAKKLPERLLGGGRGDKEFVDKQKGLPSDSP